jgi:hypothetical protein
VQDLLRCLSAFGFDGRGVRRIRTAIHRRRLWSATRDDALRGPVRSPQADVSAWPTAEETGTQVGVPALLKRRMNEAIFKCFESKINSLKRLRVVGDSDPPMIR